mgnify:CR=1 FL=1
MTERYLGSIISPSPTEPSEGFADSTASGVWNVHDPLIFGQAGDWPDPTNASPSKFIENLFSCFAYTGNGGSQTITNGIDLSNEGGLVWLKCRNAAEDNMLFDTARGATNYIQTNTTAQQYSGFSQAFTSSGFSFNTDDAHINDSSNTYMSWTFRKQPKFFDIVTYTGDGATDRDINHSLGSEPGMIWIKRTDNSESWIVYHRSLHQGGGSGTTAYWSKLELESTGAQNGGTRLWGSGSGEDHTTTTFHVSSSSSVNASSATYVAYLFAHNNNDGGFGSTGDQDIIKCGSYTGNASSNGPEIDLGFEPQWLMIKSANNSTRWVILDNIRGLADGSTPTLLANATSAEASEALLKPTSTGFKILDADTSVNASGSTIIYVAIRRGLMQTPTAATDVFAIDSLDGTPLPSWDSGFPVDMALMRYNVDISDDTQIASRLLSGRQLLTDTSAAESNNALHTFDFMAGWGSRTSTTANWYSWMFRRAPGFFDVVAYTGDGNTYQTITHNLGAVPQFIIGKRRDGTSDWVAYYGSGLYNVFLNLDASITGLLGITKTGSAGSAIDSITQFDVTKQAGGNASKSLNTSGEEYVLYIFGSLDGISKVGTYSGTGSDINVDCGFTSGARLVIVKRTDSSGDWYFWDTTNGIVAGDDPYLLLNTSDRNVTNTDYIDPLSSGFTITSNAQSDLNTSGGTYLFLAIA